MILFPQLPHHIALEMVELARLAPISSLANQSRAVHPACKYTPVGGTRATVATLTDIRDQLLQLAIIAGYPSSPGVQAAAIFDAEAAMLINQKMLIAPAEAAKGGVWEFLSCVLLPDIVRWRFGGASLTITPIERFVAGRRNVFQRLWWRAYHLAPRSDCAPPLSELLHSLGEDELVQLMERPSLAGIDGLPGFIAAGLLSASATHTTLTRRQLIREAQKRFLRLTSFLSFESIHADEIRHHVATVFEQVGSSLRIVPEMPMVASSF
jgi:hypothetical protein